MRHLNPRAGAHVVTALLSVVLATTALAAPATSAPAPRSSVSAPTEDSPAPGPTGGTDVDPGDLLGGDAPETRRPRPDYKIATLNLHNSMGTAAMRHDVRTIIRAGATVIGMQERRGTKRKVRRTLPKHWALAMPTGKDGSDDNPVAWNTRVWRAQRTWPAVLTKKTWHRDGYGTQAVNQYAVVAQLRHRRSGHVIRAASLHMPAAIQTKQGGGPRWSQRDRVEAFWRMSRKVRRLEDRTPAGQQFVVMCDCNVSYTRDRSKHLLKGKVSRPLRMASNYSAGGTKRGWQIDYVLAERRKRYRIKSWTVHHNLRTDHPGVVTRFVHR